jgi:carbon-monoxide dehydrogenase large subunit
MAPLDDVLGIPGNEYVLDRLQGLLSSEQAIAFVGAGASAGLYPLWDGLIRQLADEAVTRGLATDADRQTWLRFAPRNPQQAVRGIKDSLGRKVYGAVLGRIFGYQAGDDGKPFTPIQRLLLELPLRGYVTTNYDPGLLEARSAVRPGVRATGYATWQDADAVRRWQTGEVFGEQACPVLYAHGIYEKSDTIVLGVGEYRDAYRPGAFRELVGKLWSQEHLVFVGFGFADSWFDVIAEQILGLTARQAAGEPRHVAILGLPENEPYSPQLREYFRDAYDAEMLLYPVQVTERDGLRHEDHSMLRIVLEELPRPFAEQPSSSPAPEQPETPESRRAQQWPHETTEDADVATSPSVGSPRPQLAYLNFDVLIDRAGEGIYRARVLDAPAGQTLPVLFTQPFAELELENFLLRIGRPRRNLRRIDVPQMETIKTFGGRLFDTVFRDELRVSLLSSYNRADSQDAGLRIRLRLSDCPELAELPWEYLYDRVRNRFFCLSDHTPLVRFLELPDPVRVLLISPPLRVLVMIASPSDFPQLDVEQEWAKLNTALGELVQAGRVTVERLEPATLRALQKRLRRADYHVFHFIGHGGFDSQAQDGVLVLEDQLGRGRLVSGQELGALLHDHRSLRLAVLNACEGARSDKTDPFAGTAQSLVQQGIPAVVAMQFEITDEAAITFANVLYEAIADGYPLDAAIAEARKAIYAEGNYVEWGTPVLYLRAPDGRIFDLLKSPPVPAPTRQRPRQEAAQGAEAPPVAPPARTLGRPSEQMAEVGRAARYPEGRLGPWSAHVTGQGSYVDNLTAPGMVWVSVLRSPIAHGRIDRVDTAAAMDMPGVIAVYSGADLASDWAASLPCAWPATANTKMPTHWPVTQDKTRYQGEPIAVVVADKREHAVDGVESIEVDYEVLPTLMDLDAALGAGTPLIHDDLGTNVCFDDYKLERGNVDRVFAEAPVVVKETYWHPRLIPTAIEPRGALVQPKPGVGEFTVWSSTQIPHLLRTTLALTLGISESKLRMIAPDVGGGFGSKLDVYPEEAICLAIARRLGRPVKWIEERSENYVATHHGRGVRQDIEVAATKEGKLLGVRVKVLADMGAYTQFFTPALPSFGAPLYAGPYGADAYSVQIAGVFTNRTPTGAYRGAGRAEATFAIERIMDTLARRVGKDPAEIRRMNFIPPFDRSTAAPSGARYDSGNYEAGFEKALELADYHGLRREQAKRRQRSDVKQLGIGLSAYVTQSVSASSREVAVAGDLVDGWEVATIRCEPTGKVTVVTGTSPHGQDHEASWAQIAANALGVNAEDIEVLRGDTATSPKGLDTYGSRSVAIGGVAIELAAGKIISKAKKIFAHKTGVAEEDVEWTEGKLRVRGAPRRAETIPNIAVSAWNPRNLPKGMEPGLEETYKYDPPNSTYPSGTHVCVVEVDTETGLVEVAKYVAVEDAGNLVTPIVADGMVQGGAVQGIAEAIFEEAIYDDDGNLLQGNMSLYGVPSAAEVPPLLTDHVATPSSSNPGGWKGIGEAATIGAPPAVVNAVINALQSVGVTYVGKPVSPENVWRAIQSARDGGTV